MKLNIRSSITKRSKKTGYRTRQQSKGGRKVNRRQRPPARQLLGAPASVIRGDEPGPTARES
jgi:ribosomal protein L34